MLNHLGCVAKLRKKTSKNQIQILFEVFCNPFLLLLSFQFQSYDVQGFGESVSRRHIIKVNIVIV